MSPPLQALKPRHGKIAVKILILLSGISVADCCDILDVINFYLNDYAADAQNLNNVTFDLLKIIDDDS